jgi:hypothetical protein
MSKLAVIYYSATGHGTTMAHHVANAGERAGAEVRVRHVAETHDPTSFAHNPAWAANYNATKDLPAASGDGNPYGVSHITGPDNQSQVAEPTTAALTHLAHRVVAIAARLAT